MKAQQVESLLAGVRDTNGEPLAAGKVFHYVAGTTTDKALYTAADMSSSAAQPYVLDAYGRGTVWGYGAYKFIIKDSADNTIYTWDNLRYGYDDDSYYGGTDTGSANTYVITTTPGVSAYEAGQRFTFKAGATNTGASTLNVDGLGVKNIRLYDGTQALTGGEIPINAIIDVEYDGTQFQLLRDTRQGRAIKSGTAGSTASVSSTSATYVDYTGLSISLTIATGDKVLLTSEVSVSHSVANSQMLTKFTEDGTGIGTEQSITAYRSSTNGADTVISNSLLYTPASTGSKTYKVQWVPGGATGYSVRATMNALVIGAY